MKLGDTILVPSAYGLIGAKIWHLTETTVTALRPDNTWFYGSRKDVKPLE